MCDMFPPPRRITRPFGRVVSSGPKPPSATWRSLIDRRPTPAQPEAKDEEAAAAATMNTATNTMPPGTTNTQPLWSRPPAGRALDANRPSRPAAAASALAEAPAPAAAPRTPQQAARITPHTPTPIHTTMAMVRPPLPRHVAARPPSSAVRTAAPGDGRAEAKGPPVAAPASMALQYRPYAHTPMSSQMGDILGEVTPGHAAPHGSASNPRVASSVMPRSQSLNVDVAPGSVHDSEGSAQQMAE